MLGSHTADDLVEAADAAGFPGLTTRLITDWVQRGLLDRPARQSKGRGKGSAKATFPDAQRDLLLLLLRRRGESSGVAHLLAIPVAIWLYWGDDFVLSRQALRALTTWAKHYETAPAGRARGGVQDLVTQIAHPDAGDTDLRALQRTLQQAATSRSAFQRDLSRRITAVVDPHRQGRTLGLPGLPIDPDTLVRSWLRQRRAISKLLAHEVGLSKLEQARNELRQSVAEYVALQPAIVEAAAADPFNAISPTPPQLEVLVQNAAKDILLPLAHVLMADDR